MAEAIVQQLDTNGAYSATEVIEYLKASFVRGERPDTTLLEKVLVAALARFPSRDFPVFLSFVPLQLQESSDKIRALKALENELERCNFAAFWALWATHRATLPASAAFEETVKESIVQVLLDSVLRMELSRATSALNVADVAVYLKGKKIAFTIDKSDIVFPANQFNSPESSANTTEKLGMQQVLSIVTRSQWSM